MRPDRKVNPLDHQKLVYSIAYKLLPKACGIEFDDLVSEGQIGLLLACERFDPSRHFAFSTYATVYIRGYMLKAIAEQPRPLPIPADIHPVLEKLKAKKLTLEDIPATSRDRVADAQHVTSRHYAPSLALETCWRDRRHDTEPSMLAERALMMVGELPDTRRSLINEYFGLGRHMPATLTEIARRRGYTRQRAQQVLHRTLGTLRGMMARGAVA